VPDDEPSNLEPQDPPQAGPANQGGAENQLQTALDDALAQAIQLQEAAQARAAELEQTAAQLQSLSTQHAQLTTQHLAALRRALLAENAGQVVEELVRGDTAEDLESSVTLARQAYARIAGELRTAAATQVPLGASPVGPPPIEELSPIAKITQALSRNSK
jgi:hypothetical protein